MKTVIEMAREAGLFTHKEVQPEIERFAELIRADEREACAKLADKVEYCGACESDVARAIRAMGSRAVGNRAYDRYQGAKMKTVIEMAREAGVLATFKTLHPSIEILAELVRADERERIYFQTSSDFVKAAIADEREACAKVAEDSDHVVAGRGYYDQLGDADATARNITAAIRARGSNT